jgi:hypothetical protein
MMLLTSNIRSVRHWDRLRVLGETTEPVMLRLALESLGIPTAAPGPARARDPTALLAD